MLFIFAIYFSSLLVPVNGVRLHVEEILRAGPTYSEYEFDIYHHLTGISPYFESTKNQLNPSPPANCVVDRTAYLIRHGSVYVDDYDYLKIIKPFLKRLNNGDISKSLKLAFLNKWKSPITNPKEQIEKLTKSGILESLQLGFQLAYRYPHLLPKKNDKSFRIWTASSGRTSESALALFKGLFGARTPIGRVVPISESKTRGANSLTPMKSCQKYNASKGSKEAHLWLAQYTRSIIDRLDRTLIPNDILAMQELCGYESVIRGSSPFCQLFTTEEWLAFEYYFDLKYHHELGYANPLSPYLGMPWLKATTDLFDHRTKNSQKIYLSVTHREMLPVTLLALGLYNQSESYHKEALPTHEINHDRLWKTSSILPFLGRIALERLQCSSRYANQSFVRVSVNSLPKPIPGCSQGPGQTCPLTHFIHYINQRYQTYRNFSQICQTDSNHQPGSDELTFFTEKR